MPKIYINGVMIEEIIRLYPPPLQGSLKPLKNMMFPADLLRAISIFCR